MFFKTWYQFHRKNAITLNWFCENKVETSASIHLSTTATFFVPADKKSINWLLYQTSLQRPLSCLRRRRSNIYECVGRLQRRLPLSSVPKVAVVERQERFNCTTLIINNRPLLSLNVVHCLSENSVLQWFGSYYTLRQTSKATDPAYK